MSRACSHHHCHADPLPARRPPDQPHRHWRLALLGVLSYGTPLMATLLLVWFGFATLTWTLAGAAALIIGGAALAMTGRRTPARLQSA